MRVPGSSEKCNIQKETPPPSSFRKHMETPAATCFVSPACFRSASSVHQQPPDIAESTLHMQINGVHDLSWWFWLHISCSFQHFLASASSSSEWKTGSMRGSEQSQRGRGSLSLKNILCTSCPSVCRQAVYKCVHAVHTFWLILSLQYLVISYEQPGYSMINHMFNPKHVHDTTVILHH